jgi:exodeoxyribonuclease V alpha subunit
MNHAVRRALGRPAAPVVGDVVMCLRNDHKREPYPVYNGMKGAIVSISPLSVSVLYEGEDEPIVYSSANDDVDEGGLPYNHVYGYASTIHKAQGSEFDYVVAAIPESMARNRFMQVKSLVYTACSRAKVGLTLIEAPGALQAIAKLPAKRPETVLRHILPSANVPVEGEDVPF